MLGWEGWIRYLDGRLGHSASHQGVTLPSALSSAEAYRCVRTSIELAQKEHESQDEPIDGTLLFCITVDTGPAKM
ncbi:hypothetical protein SAMN05444062_10426 [Pseudomonas syringae]|nr:hypothetical protein SAMN05444062_10426 [Pseudomonas syringae]